MERAWKTDQENGMVYYVGIYGCWDIKFENPKKCWLSSIHPFYTIFKRQYLRNHISKYSKLYLFLDQFFMLFPLVSLIFPYEQV